MENPLVVQLLTTPDLFRTWLDSQLPSEVIGMACCSTECPIARFLVAKGVFCPSVSESHIRSCDSNGDVFDNTNIPQWVERLVAAVDIQCWKGPFNSEYNQERRQRLRDVTCGVVQDALKVATWNLYG